MNSIFFELLCWQPLSRPSPFFFFPLDWSFIGSHQYFCFATPLLLSSSPPQKPFFLPLEPCCSSSKTRQLAWAPPLVTTFFFFFFTLFPSLQFPFRWVQCFSFFFLELSGFVTQGCHFAPEYRFFFFFFFPCPPLAHSTGTHWLWSLDSLALKSISHVSFTSFFPLDISTPPSQSPSTGTPQTFPRPVTLPRRSCSPN